MSDSAVHKLICRKYATAHAAQVEPCFSDYVSRDVAGRTVITLGYRRALRERLFLGVYLDRPIELELGILFGHEITRADIVEIGNLASDNAMAMIALWSYAANDLGGSAEIAVAVLTAPLRSMFRRLGVTIYQICPADPARLGGSADQWGAYYRLDPVVCAGFIAEGQEKLARITSRKAGAA